MKQVSVRAISFAMASLIAVSGLAFISRPVSAATEATLLKGGELRNALWETAGGGDRAMLSFQKGSNPPSNAKAIDENKTGSVVAWAKNGNVYWYSKCDKVYLNADSSAMFDQSKSVTSIDMSGLDTSRVTTMEKMFQSCIKMTSLNISNFNTSNVTSMVSMFAGCRVLKKLDVSSFNTKKVTRFSNMFSSCRELTSIDVRSFDTSSATDFGSMFKECCKVKTIYLGRNFITDKATNYTGMFSTKYDGTTSLTTIYSYNDFKEVLYLDGFDDSSVKYEMYMFDGCSKLAGGAGTKYSNYTATDDYNYFKSSRFARVDGGSKKPGYFTKYDADPTNTPTVTKKPTATPTKAPTAKPTVKPTAKPTAKATATPTPKSSDGPTGSKISMTLAGTVVCGKTIKATTKVTPSSAKVTFKSSNSKIATVDQSGNVKGIMAGQVTITATSSSGAKVSSKVQVLYKDVTSSKDFWFTPTNDLTNRGIVKGYDKQTRFKPANECTRAQMVTFIWRMQGEPAPKTKTCKFKDVKKSDYFYNACLWGNEKGIVEGYKNGTFGPKIVCARRHAVTFLWRLANKPTPKTTKNKFKDVKSSDYFYKATLWASEKGILAGYSDNTFRPNGECLRRQMVTFLYKYNKVINKK